MCFTGRRGACPGPQTPKARRRGTVLPIAVFGGQFQVVETVPQFCRAYIAQHACQVIRTAGKILPVFVFQFGLHYRDPAVKPGKKPYKISK
jgi:hypothetical protein